MAELEAASWTWKRNGRVGRESWSRKVVAIWRSFGGYILTGKVDVRFGEYRWPRGTPRSLLMENSKIHPHVQKNIRESDPREISRGGDLGPHAPPTSPEECPPFFWDGALFIETNETFPKTRNIRELDEDSEMYTQIPR
jgi:hypothetical protein